MSEHEEKDTEQEETDEPEPDQDELLGRMETILTEMQEQSERFELLEKSKNLTPQDVMAEMRSTILTFMTDVATTAFQSITLIQEDMDELLDADAAAPEPESQLMPEDAAELIELLGMSAAMMGAAMQAPDVNDEQRAVLQSQIERMQRAIAMCRDITIELPPEETTESSPLPNSAGATLPS